MTFFRPTKCSVDLDALAHNFHALRRLAGDRKFIAVVKSNAYGHGAPRIALALENLGVDMLAVVSLEEAIELREAGIRKPILILGIVLPSTAELIAAYRVIPAVFSPTVAHAFQTAALRLGARMAMPSRDGQDGPERGGALLPIHIKIDSGMGRLGVRPSDFQTLAATLRECPNLAVEGVFTHLAKADTDPEFTHTQLKQFGAMAEGMTGNGRPRPMRHAANSAAVLAYPEAHLDAVRPGLALYGVSPFGDEPTSHPLKPILTLSTRILFLKQVPSDTSISYGGTFKTQRPSLIATLPIGYADGFTRLRSNPSEGMGRREGGNVLIRGKRAPIVGRITMDLTMVDVTDVPGAAVDDEVMLIGTQGDQSITAAEWAGEVGTIPYEVLCGISTRVPRTYVGIGGLQPTA